MGMWEFLLFFFEVLLLSMALFSQVTIKPRSIITIAGYWFLSFAGQCFAPQLAFLTLVLAVASLWVFTENSLLIIAMATALMALALWVRVYWMGYKTQAVVDPVIQQAIERLGLSLDQVPLSSPVKGLLGLHPFRFGKKGVKKIANIAYGPHGKFNLLDIYQPEIKPDQPMPVLIQVPGGAWVTGSKNDQGLPMVHHMARQGWLCVSINYRLGPAARFPAMLEDVLAAIHWVKTHCAEYGADPDYVAITGGSAGGHLLTLAALIKDRAQFQPGFEEADTSVNLAVPFYGRYDFLNRHKLLPEPGLEPFLATKVMPGNSADYPDLWAYASPESQVHAKPPPFLLVHGTADAMIPIEEARAFCTAFEGVAPGRITTLEIPGAQHAFDLVCSSWAMPTVWGVGRYLQAHYRHYLAESAGQSD